MSGGVGLQGMSYHFKKIDLTLHDPTPWQMGLGWCGNGSTGKMLNKSLIHISSGELYRWRSRGEIKLASLLAGDEDEDHLLPGETVQPTFLRCLLSSLQCGVTRSQVNTQTPSWSTSQCRWCRPGPSSFSRLRTLHSGQQENSLFIYFVIPSFSSLNKHYWII